MRRARKHNPNAAGAVTGLLAVCALTGCAPAPAPPGQFALVIGSHGYVSAKFHRPRGIAFDAPENSLFVVDWSGRIQKFSPDGAFRASWRMPKVEKGKPEDLCISGRRTLLVADTHYSRIIEFSLNGRLLKTFGSYGREPGRFIYPVGICCDPEGNIYVSEYGENDRIQKFTPDHSFVKSWGRFGSEPGQFQRPSGIAISGARELYVADAVNHRLQVFDLDGNLRRLLGGEGTGPGQFRYPYDVALRGHTVYVLEYGNQRVQKLHADGSPIAVFGSGGRGPGRFACPWRCAVTADALYVSDTDNSRVVKLPASF